MDAEVPLTMPSSVTIRLLLLIMLLDRIAETSFLPPLVGAYSLNSLKLHANMDFRVFCSMSNAGLHALLIKLMRSSSDLIGLKELSRKRLS